MADAGWDSYCAPREDNVRPVPGGLDPAACGHNPWRGNVDPGAHGRSIVNEGDGPLCGVCRFTRGFGSHCFLYEICDRCFPDDPAQQCPTKHQMAEQREAAQS